MASHQEVNGRSSPVDGAQNSGEGCSTAGVASRWPPTTAPLLEPGEYARYGRQMILAAFGLENQLRLRSSKVLVIGGGGLGCPAIQYLASCGIGTITVVDHDVVEHSNLSRQVLHNESTIGLPKVESVRLAIAKLNPHVKINAVQEQFTVDNGASLVSSHDVVLDCTDNPLTRYLINDIAVLYDKMVISGAGQGYEGQLVILNYNNLGPCYRCLFPIAPKPSEVKDCAESGVLGTITGIVGTLQANECIKLLTSINSEQQQEEGYTPTMILINLLEANQRMFKSIKLRPRKPNCKSCDPNNKDKITLQNIKSEDYLFFCGLNQPSPTQDSIATKQITVQDLSDLSTRPEFLLDVRTTEEFSIVRLEGSHNIPYSTIRSNPSQAIQTIQDLLPGAKAVVHVLCLRGNDSLLAAELLNTSQKEVEFVDVKGGLKAWKKVVDVDFPDY
ncbi:unnamed protein product [Sympodiomycopsis kandeliae]